MNATTGFAEPQPKKHYKKRLGFAKDNKMAKRRLFAVGTPSKKISLSRPSSGIRQTARMPSRPIPFKVVTRKGDQTTTKAMFVPHASELMTMDVLCQVMSMIRCSEPGCCGLLQLHKQTHRDGLQSSFVLHCRRCHSLVANFPSSLHIGESPQDAVKNQMMSLRRASEVNSRALFAVHSTSMSWLDFPLFSALLDLPVPGHNLGKRTLKSLTSCTSQVSRVYVSSCCRSEMP